MSWTRPTNWTNGPQYDSADLPFSPPNDAGYLEGGSPFWKLNNLAEVEKTYPPKSALQAPMGKEHYQSTLVKLFGVANSFSQEDLSSSNRIQSAGDSNNRLTVEDYRRMTQSLPATPLTTPATTPAPTPGPTPQSSPLVPRKNIVDPASSHQQPTASTNAKWWFFPQPATNTSSANSGNWIASVRMDGSMPADKAVPAGGQDPAVIPAQSCRRKCAPLISNRDVNFFAPTSM